MPHNNRLDYESEKQQDYMSPIVLPHTFKIQKIGIFKFGIFLSYV